MKKPKIVFFGTPEFAVASLDALVKNGYDVASVVTVPDKVAGRGHKLLQSDVKRYAIKSGIPVLQPEKLRSEEFISALRTINADLFIVIAFRMLPEVVWTMPPLGTFNLHASLLPKYRGAAPINRAIMNGETETGITTFFLKHEIDTGDMIDMRKTSISPEDNAGTLHDRLMSMGADMVLDTVKAISQGKLTLQPQPEGEFISAPKIFKEDCIIDWTRSAKDIHNQVRGLSPYPAAFTMIIEKNGRRHQTKIFRAQISDKDSANFTPGTALIQGKQLWIATGDKMLEILELQPAGKKGMPASAFLQGYTPDRASNIDLDKQ